MIEESTSFRDSLYTIDSEGNRNWVYSGVVKGRFFYLRSSVAYVLMAIYLVMPWISIGGKQAVHLDIYNRLFTFFGTTFWATDTLYLMLFLGSLGITLFFFTALLGRVWCGWACPETVFLEFLFRPIERLVEGNSAQRKRLDEAPWRIEKIFKKTLKHGLFVLLAWLLASTALAYFFGSYRMIEMMSDLPWNNPGPFFTTLALMAALLFQFGWFREQFCTVLCPYARFQSVMLDPNSIVIGYDVTRGEPRGKLSGRENAKRGDCVDCGACVRVCPTGIDIRNGLQLECVNCAACIDACDSIMDKVGFPRGLIRYATENKLLGKPSTVLRPRLLIYATILLVFLSIFLHSLRNRSGLEVDLLRAVGTMPYSVLPDGRLSNQLNLQLMNKTSTPATITVRLASPDVDSIEVILPGSPITVPAQSLVRSPLFINFPREALLGSKREIVIETRSTTEHVQGSFILIGPE